MATTATYGTLSTSHHGTQLRKAVIAATIGTAIKWYDFIYGAAAGLIFGKLYFPNEDPLTGTLAAFGTYFIGFVGRPIGAAIFGHYGDRIGIIRTFGTWGTGDGQLRSPRALAQQQPHRGVEQPPGDQAS